MSANSTSRFLKSYEDQAPLPLFLSGLFQSPPENFHDSESVEIDIMRDDADIATIVRDVSSSANMNAIELFSNKELTPPVVKEGGAITANDTMARGFGQSSFDSADFNLRVLTKAQRIMRKLGEKVARHIELQCSQVLQTGALSLAGDGVTYTLDYQMTSTHSVNAAATWAVDGSTGDPETDIDALAQVITANGKKQPNQCIMGSSAAARFMRNAKIVAQLNIRNASIGNLAPVARGEGATFLGTFMLSGNAYECWKYAGTYKHPTTGTITPYLGTNKVIVRAKEGRLDLSFGSIKLVSKPEVRAASFIPRRYSSSARGYDLNVNPWISADNTAIQIDVGTRPLAIPTAIDTFGILDVEAA